MLYGKYSRTYVRSVVSIGSVVSLLPTSQCQRLSELSCWRLLWIGAGSMNSATLDKQCHQPYKSEYGEGYSPPVHL